MSDPRITPEEVLHVARLARLQLRGEEVDGLQQDLSRILNYVAKLDELNTDGVEASAHAIHLPSRMREDIPKPGLPVDQALATAPERIGNGFGVPKIIE